MRIGRLLLRFLGFVLLLLLALSSLFFLLYQPAVSVGLAVITVCFALMPSLFKKSETDPSSRNLRYLVVSVFVMAIVYVVLTLLPVSLPLPKSTPALAFKGSSSEAKHTCVVPTLDTPLEADKNAVWCASFQTAWDALRRDKLEGAPVQLTASQTIADRLNKAQLKPEVLPQDHYAVAGCVSEDFLARIKQETTRRFPDVPFSLTDFENLPDDANLLAYAFLRAYVSFCLPYKREKAGMLFEGDNGQSKQVGAFGIREKDEFSRYELREQIQVLYTDDAGPRPEEYALDISLGTDTQLLLARVPRGDTLQSTLDYLRGEMEKAAQQQDADYIPGETAEFPSYPADPEFGPSDVVLVPEMSWEIDHHFTELEGVDKVLLNPIDCGGWLGEARQVISFTLDRSGARLTSEARIIFRCSGRRFVFDKPFLLALQRRDADIPYFVMWVDNPELLSPV